MSVPGIALTNQFQFSTATVCVAPVTNQLTINAADHSIGLVKNVTVTAENSRVDLTQGLSNQIVASAVNGQNITATMEVFEYTSRNLAYGLGLDGSGLQLSQAPELVATASGTSVTVAANVTTKFPAGAWVFIQAANGDRVHIARVASSTFTSPNTAITLETGFAIPAGLTFGAGSRVGPINKIDANPANADQTFAVRVIGTMLIDKRPMVLHFPKARITRGFSVAFNSDNFSNLPFEIVPMAPTPADPGFNAQFSQIMSVLAP